MEWLTGTKRRLYTLTILSILGVSWFQVIKHGLDTNTTNLLIWVGGTTAAAYASGRWAEAKENTNAKAVDPGSKG